MHMGKKFLKLEYQLQALSDLEILYQVWSHQLQILSSENSQYRLLAETIGPFVQKPLTLRSS